jgi:hypothetical protein
LSAGMHLLMSEKRAFLGRGGFMWKIEVALWKQTQEAMW